MESNEEIRSVNYIIIPCTYRDFEFSFPAYSFVNGNNEEIYIILHRALKDAFFQVVRKYDDVRIEVVDIDTSINHCITSVVITSNDHKTPLWFKGEVTTKSLPDSVKDTPSKIAEKRAFDSAVIEFFGLYSKVFQRNGDPEVSPVMYSDTSAVNGLISTLKERTTPPSDAEKAYFQEVSDTLLKFKVNGTFEEKPISEWDMETLKTVLEINVGKDRPELLMKQKHVKEYLDMLPKFKEV